MNVVCTNIKRNEDENNYSKDWNCISLIIKIFFVFLIRTSR